MNPTTSQYEQFQSSTISLNLSTSTTSTLFLCKNKQSKGIKKEREVLDSFTRVTNGGFTHARKLVILAKDNKKSIKTNSSKEN